MSDNDPAKRRKWLLSAVGALEALSLTLLPGALGRQLGLVAFAVATGLLVVAATALYRHELIQVVTREALRLRSAIRALLRHARRRRHCLILVGAGFIVFVLLLMVASLNPALFQRPLAVPDVSLGREINGAAKAPLPINTTTTQPEFGTTPTPTSTTTTTPVSTSTTTTWPDDHQPEFVGGTVSPEGDNGLSQAVILGAPDS